MLSNAVKRCITRRNADIKTIVAFLQQRNNSSTSNNPNIVRSKFPDVEISNVFIEDVIFKGLDKWGDKTAVVSFILKLKLVFMHLLTSNVLNTTCTYLINKTL